MKYHIVLDNDLTELMKAVQGFLDDGWECLGGISLSIAYLPLPEDRTYNIYAQAMVKRSPK